MSEPDFPKSEFEARVERAQSLMHEQNMGALFFTSEAEIRYFTGFRTLFWQSPTRPWFLVLLGEGKPIAIIPEIGAALMRNTWIDDIRTWASPAELDDGISLLTSVLENYSTIGMMMGRESALRMPLADYQNLRYNLRFASFVDVSPLIQSLRMIKSPAEIETISAICTITSNSFENAGNLFFEGQLLNEAFRAFKIELLKQGAEDVPYLVGGAGEGGYGDVISPPDETPLRTGDVLMLDTGSTLRGYFCDFDRNFAIGQANDAAKIAYEILHQATEAALKIARPGITCANLYQVMANVIGGEGGDVGRYGHGLGMQLTEGPSIISFDHTELVEGMVLTLEPSMQVSKGKVMVHEENIVIRDGAPQLLTKRAPSELPIL